MVYMIKVGEQAVDFQLQDQAGVTHQLSDYRGRWVLLYFYPKDDTPGCTKEACMIRDAWTEFKTAGVVVLGVSADTTESHQKFADKHNLPFPLLADTEKKVLQEYGAFKEKSMFGKSFLGIQRMSYLIGPDGAVAKVYPKVKPDVHADEVLADIADLKK